MKQAQSYTFKVVITVIVAGLVGAIWLGVKVMLGKRLAPVPARAGLCPIRLKC
jgi:hypothetical protein